MSQSGSVVLLRKGLCVFFLSLSEKKKGEGSQVDRQGQAKNIHTDKERQAVMILLDICFGFFWLLLIFFDGLLFLYIVFFQKKKFESCKQESNKTKGEGVWGTQRQKTDSPPKKKQRMKKWGSTHSLRTPSSPPRSSGSKTKQQQQQTNKHIKKNNNNNGKKKKRT